VESSGQRVVLYDFPRDFGEPEDRVVAAAWPIQFRAEQCLKADSSIELRRLYLTRLLERREAWRTRSLGCGRRSSPDLGLSLGSVSGESRRFA
jgi:hypothetical protein